MQGHPTGIRDVVISSDDRFACTVSKSMTKVWDVRSRSCILSLSPENPQKSRASVYGLCSTFLPGNAHLVVGTREGHLLLVDIAAGDVVLFEENAHEAAIWSIDVRSTALSDVSGVCLVTGSADKSVKFWELENDDTVSHPIIVHTRTLQMTDDVIAVRYSYSIDRSRLLVFVATLDCTVKVFFDDSLKLFLSLYGHKLPVLAMDASDDDHLLASAGADKTIKIFGLDFGDTHKTLHGHEDSITDLRFVKRTHNFFTTSKDGTARYWDADRFEQVLVLNGHFAEVNSLAVSNTGAFVLTGGMDRQVRVWERTRDIVFLEEERERELERAFENINGGQGESTSYILSRNEKQKDGDEDENQPQSEAAMRKSIASVSSSDRIVECIEQADQESRDIALFRKTSRSNSIRKSNPMMLNMDPATYVLWVLKTVKSAELEQSIVILPIAYVGRLMHYILILVRSGRGVELCSRVAILLTKTHQNQVRPITWIAFFH